MGLTTLQHRDTVSHLGYAIALLMSCEESRAVVLWEAVSSTHKKISRTAFPALFYGRPLSEVAEVTAS